MSDGWTVTTICSVCGPASGCEAQDHPRYTRWMLKNDAGEMIAVVERFHDGMPCYGNTAYGRTGPIMDLDRCKAACVADIEAGKNLADERMRTGGTNA